MKMGDEEKTPIGKRQDVDFRAMSVAIDNELSGLELRPFGMSIT